jgi:hypothetical protein
MQESSVYMALKINRSKFCSKGSIVTQGKAPIIRGGHSQGVMVKEAEKLEVLRISMKKSIVFESANSHKIFQVWQRNLQCPYGTKFPFEEF